MHAMYESSMDFPMNDTRQPNVYIFEVFCLNRSQWDEIQSESSMMGFFPAPKRIPYENCKVDSNTHTQNSVISFWNKLLQSISKINCEVKHIWIAHNIYVWRGIKIIHSINLICGEKSFVFWGIEIGSCGRQSKFKE